MRKKSDSDGVAENVPILTASPTILTNMHPDLMHPPLPELPIGKNQYQLVEVDAQGNEIPGTDFVVGEVTYQTSFATNKSFKIKKNI